MTTFDKREDAFEKQFAHDEELKFKAEARRNKLLGLWAAEKLGKSGADADAYAKEVVAADFEEAGDAFDPETAAKLYRLIYSSGGSMDPEDAYIAFRGALPTPDALIAKEGLA